MNFARAIILVPMSKPNSISQDQVVAAIRSIQTKLVWKPNSASRHLAKRILRGHLTDMATIADYQQILETVLHGDHADVYIFWYDNIPYVAIVDMVHQSCWLVMFNLNGVLESAYIVERPDLYLRKEHIVFVDSLKAVMS